MNKLSEQVVGALLDKLLKYGDTRLRETADGEEIARTVETLLGYRVSEVDTGFKVLKEVRVKLVASLDTVAASLALRAAASLEEVESELVKQSFLSSWGMLAAGAKVIVWALLLFIAVASGFSGYEIYRSGTLDYEAIMYTVGIPSVALLVLATVPIKTVAYLGLHAATKMVDHRFNKTKNK